jgi:hypothetical protein
MDPVMFLSLVVFMAMAMVLTAFLHRRRQERPVEHPPGDGMLRGVEKIDFLIDHCRETLDATKLRRGNGKYTHYYIGYLFEVARQVAQDEGVEFSTAFQTPVLLEAIRLCGAEGRRRGDRLIAAILSSPACRRGAADGRADAAHSLDPLASGPYWTRIRAFFEDVRSDA